VRKFLNTEKIPVDFEPKLIEINEQIVKLADEKYAMA
jgi:hypothetical protein